MSLAARAFIDGSQMFSDDGGGLYPGYSGYSKLQGGRWIHRLKSATTSKKYSAFLFTRAVHLIKGVQEKPITKINTQINDVKIQINGMNEYIAHIALLFIVDDLKKNEIVNKYHITYHLTDKAWQAVNADQFKKLIIDHILRGTSKTAVKPLQPSYRPLQPSYKTSQNIGDGIYIFSGSNWLKFNSASNELAVTAEPNALTADPEYKQHKDNINTYTEFKVLGVKDKQVYLWKWGSVLEQIYTLCQSCYFEDARKLLVYILTNEAGLNLGLSRQTRLMDIQASSLADAVKGIGRALDHVP